MLCESNGNWDFLDFGWDSWDYVLGGGGLTWTDGMEGMEGMGLEVVWLVGLIVVDVAIGGSVWFDGR